MRPLISLYKNYLYAKRQSPKFLVFWGLTALTIVFGACRVHQTNNNSDANTASDWNLNPVRALANMAGGGKGSEPALKLVATDRQSTANSAATDNTPVFAELIESSCNGNALSLATRQIWRLRFSSALGPHMTTLTIDANSEGAGTAVAEIDGRRLSFGKFSGLNSELMQTACTAVKDDKDSLSIADGTATEAVKQWLSRIAPDCDFDLTSTGWTCALPTIDSSLAQTELDGIHRTMIMRWNRQPYLISRRLAVTRSLAQAVREPSAAGERLNTLCRIIGFALPAELPLALATQNWQEGVCKAPGANRLQLARIGLSKALDEIDYLRKLFEQNSKLGTLVVRIPRAQVPTRDVWVSLKPAIEETTTTRVHHACWHPLFNNQSDFLATARQLDLLSESDGTSCDSVTNDNENTALVANQAEGAQPPLDPIRYLAESITSETEFVITNGQSKLLRLPMGTYTYIVRPHSEALSELETDPNITPSTGTIVWTKQRPRVLIKQW